MECSQCSNELECTVDESCWCMEFPQIVAHTDKTKGCMCKECLKELIKDMGCD